MTGLFIELYLDEDVDVLLTDLVGAWGFQATTSQEAGQVGKTDVDQLVYAARQQKTLLTHNRADFEALAQQYFAISETHDGMQNQVRSI